MSSLVKHHAPLALIIVGFAYLFLSSLDSHGGLMWDEAEYANLGRDIHTGRSYGSSFRPPVVPLLVAAVLGTSGQAADHIIKIPIALTGLLGLGLLYAFLQRECDQVTGLVAAGCLAAMPAYWIHCTYLLSEIPFLLFFAGACFCFYWGMIKRADWFFLAWAFTGLAFLTRYTCVLLGPIFLLCLGLSALLDKRQIIATLKTKKFWLAPFVGLAIQLPWLFRQYSQFGDPLTGFRYAAGQLQRYVPEISLPAHYYLSQMPGMLTVPVLGLVLVGIAWVLRARHPLGLQMVLIALFLLCWFSAYRYKEFRLLTAILPFLATLAGLGYRQVLTKVWSGFSKPWVALAFVTVLGLYSNHLLSPFFQHNRVLGYPALKKGAQELKNYCQDGSVIMVAPSPQFAWYTEHKTISFPKQAKFYQALSRVSFVVVVNYERGQPEYVSQLVQKLFPEPANELNKYMIVDDEFKNYTFITSGAEFRRRIELDATASLKKAEQES